VAPLNFSLYTLSGMIIAQSAALFTSTHVHHTYMLHTCFSCKWYFLSFLMCAFSSTVCLLLKVLRIINMSKLLLGKEKSESGEAEAR